MKVGIVGCGWFGKIHAEAWQNTPGVELVGVCDVNPDAFLQGDMAQSSFHRDVGEFQSDPWKNLPKFESVETFLEELELDLLDVVVPEKSHFDVAAQGLSKGVNVFVEKPFVLTPDESRSLINLASDQGKDIHVGHILRFDERYVEVMNRLHSKKDKLVHMSFERNFQTSAHSVYGRTHPFFSACVHDIDLAIWVCQSPPDRVTGFADFGLGAETPDNVVGILEWDSGVRAVVQNNWHLADSCPYGFTFNSSFFTRERTINVRNVPVIEIWENEGLVEHPEFFFWPVTEGKRKGAIAEEFNYVRDCVKSALPSARVPLAQVHASICVADALIESSTTGVTKEVNL